MALQGISQRAWSESQEAIIYSNLLGEELPGINVKSASERVQLLSLFGLWVYSWKIIFAQCYQVSRLNSAESWS